MLFIKITFTILFIWFFPLVFGSGVMTLLQERYEGGKSWLFGMYLHIGVFALIGGIGQTREWTIENVLKIWMIASIILLIVGIIVVCWKKPGMLTKREYFQADINRTKYLFLMGLGIAVLICLAHMMVRESSLDTTIADSTGILYTNKEGTSISGIDGWNIYIACISMMSGLAPATIARFVISPFIMIAVFIVLELITSHIFEKDRISLRLFAVLIVIEIGFVLTNHNQGLHLLSTTWNKDVVWRYLFCFTLLYVYIMEQEKLLSCLEARKRIDIIKCIVEILIWMVALNLCGNLWGRLTNIIMLIWMVILIIITLWRRDVFRGRDY